MPIQAETIGGSEGNNTEGFSEEAVGEEIVGITSSFVHSTKRLTVPRSTADGVK